jgi:hypothetical protein
MVDKSTKLILLAIAIGLFVRVEKPASWVTLTHR